MASFEEDLSGLFEKWHMIPGPGDIMGPYNIQVCGRTQNVSMLIEEEEKESGERETKRRKTPDDPFECADNCKVDVCGTHLPAAVAVANDRGTYIFNKPISCQVEHPAYQFPDAIEISNGVLDSGAFGVLLSPFPDAVMEHVIRNIPQKAKFTNSSGVGSTFKCLTINSPFTLKMSASFELVVPAVAFYITQAEYIRFLAKIAVIGKPTIQGLYDDLTGNPLPRKRFPEQELKCSLIGKSVFQEWTAAILYREHACLFKLPLSASSLEPWKRFCAGWPRHIDEPMRNLAVFNFILEHQDFHVQLWPRGAFSNHEEPASA